MYLLRYSSLTEYFLKRVITYNSDKIIDSFYSLELIGTIILRVFLIIIFKCEMHPHSNRSKFYWIKYVYFILQL